MQIKVKGILSYPHLFSARSVNPGDDPKYSVSVLLRKDDPQLAQVRDAIAKEKLNTWPSGFPDKGRVFLKDGMIEYPDNPKMHEYMILNTSTGIDSKPSVVDMNLQPVLDPGQTCAGTVAWVAFNTFTYNQNVNKGVSAGLNAVMTTNEIGELGRLDGRPSVEAIFADVAAATNTTAAATNTMAAATTLYTMTAAANGLSREAYHASGWNDLQLIREGLMVSNIKTSF